MIMPANMYPEEAITGTLVHGDASVADRVRLCFGLDPELRQCSIRCHYFHGVAVLCGTMSSFRLRQRAQDAIRKIPGISMILNELVIGNSPCAMMSPAARQPAAS